MFTTLAHLLQEGSVARVALQARQERVAFREGEPPAVTLDMCALQSCEGRIGFPTEGIKPRLISSLDSGSNNFYLLIFFFSAAISTPLVFVGPLRSTSLAKSCDLNGYSRADSCPVVLKVMSTRRL